MSHPAWAEVGRLRRCLEQIKQDLGSLQGKVRHSTAAQEAVARIRAQCTEGLRGPQPEAQDG